MAAFSLLLWILKRNAGTWDLLLFMCERVEYGATEQTDNRQKGIIMIEQVGKKQCTGCNMCADLCPTQAITFSEDAEGFLFPRVAEEKCIRCGLCVKKCPAITEEDHSKQLPEVYAAWSKNDEIRLKSTSGGIYYELAKDFLDNHGYIVGSVYDDDWKGAHHIVGHSMEDLKRIMGSKYFQSDVRGIYNQIKELLDRGEKVLFCGSPCQSAALQCYLNREYENLFTIDFICRGINSPLAFRAYIEELEEKYGSLVSRVQLKNKQTGWQSLATYVEFENGKTYHADRNSSPWVKGFVGGGGLYTRGACYACRYRGFPRVSDLSIGDFWGIRGQSKEDLFKGISCVLVNSSKGEQLIQGIEAKIHIESRNFDELCVGNMALKVSPQPSEGRQKFFQVLREHKFSQAVGICQPETKERNCVLKKIVRFYRHLGKKVVSLYRISRYISIPQFIKWNYRSKNIVREKGTFLIPYKNAVLDLSPESRIYIHDRHLQVGINKLKGSKAETHIRMNGRAIWECHGCGLFYNTVLEIKGQAKLESGYFTANGGSVIICHKHIVIGEDVMMGRNIMVYDSDFHQVLDDHLECCNPPREVVIGDHVWLTSNINVLKGVYIGHDSLITPQSVIRKDIPEHSIVAGNSEVVGKCRGWSRESVKVDL